MTYTEFDPAAWRTSRNPLTSKQREEIQQRYTNGEPLSKLASEFGVTVSSIKNWIQPRDVRR